MTTREKNRASKVFDFEDVLKTVKNNLFKMCLIGLATGFLGFIISAFLITPKYESSIDILVNQKVKDTDAQYNVQQADLQAINTYKDILTKPLILSPALRDLEKKNNFKGDVSTLQKNISVENKNGSQVISLTAKNENPYIAADEANIIADVFTNKIKKVMKVDNVTIVSKAVPKLTPVSPNKVLFILIGFFLGFVTEMIIEVFKFLTNTTVNGTEYLNDELGLINLGTVFHIKDKEDNYNAVNIQDKGGFENSDSKDRRRV